MPGARQTSLAASILLALAAPSRADPPEATGRGDMIGFRQMIAERTIATVDHDTLGRACAEWMRAAARWKQDGDAPASADTAPSASTANSASAPFAEEPETATDDAALLALLDRLRAAGGDEAVMVRACLTGMLAQLEPQGRYIDYEEEQRAREAPRGRVGAAISIDADLPLVGEILPGTPAVGRLQPGDRIVAIDGEPTRGAKLSAIIARLRGAEGSTVTLDVMRGDAAPIRIALVRAAGQPLGPVIDIVEDIAVVRIAGFDLATPDQLAKAWADVLPRVRRGVIIDLRGNPGGLNYPATQVADMFIDGGMIGGSRGRYAQQGERWMAEPGDVAAGLPMVVLIDGRTSGGAEVVAAALHTRRGARIIGQTSRGYGTVSTIFDLRERSAGFAVPTSLILLANGSELQGHGLIPDVALPTGPDAGEALRRAIALLPPRPVR